MRNIYVNLFPVILCVILLEYYVVQGGKYSSGGSRPSYSRPSYSRPSHSPSYSRPSPSYSRPSPSPSYSRPSPSPSPSYSRPSPSPSPSYYHPSPSPSYFQPSHSAPSPSRPSGWNVGGPVAPPKTSNPVGSSPTQHNSPSAHSVPPPAGWNVGSNSGPIGPPKTNYPIGGSPTQHNSPSSHSAPPPAGWNVGQNKPGPPPYTPGTGSQKGYDVHNRPAPPPYTVGTGTHGTNTGANTQRFGTQNSAPPHQGNTAYQKPPPYNPQYQSHAAPPAYNTGYAHQPGYSNPAGYGQPPAYSSPGYGHPPAYSSPGYGHPPSGYYGNPGYNYHPPASGGVTVINNNNNYHYSSGGGYHYGGYGGYGGWHSYPSYSYTSHDVGSGALGFFLGYSLAKVTSPSYHYHSSYSSAGYTPRYDHYEVHHYYHNTNSIPKEAEIKPNAVVACSGDSGSFCPVGTYALCTNNGAVMCVASATTTVPCTDVKQTNCVKTTIPCLNSTAPECKGSSQTTTSVSLPCISTAKVYANVTFVNNSVIVDNAINTTALNSTMQNNATVGQSNVTTIQNGTKLANVAATNGTTLANVTAINGTTFTANLTTTTIPTTIVTNEKRDPPQVFCVTIVALPAERKPSEAEQAFNSAKSIFGQFAVKAFGLA